MEFERNGPEGAGWRSEDKISKNVDLSFEVFRVTTNHPHTQFSLHYFSIFRSLCGVQLQCTAHTYIYYIYMPAFVTIFF